MGILARAEKRGSKDLDFRGFKRPRELTVIGVV
jgi:hypothetical protein